MYKVILILSLMLFSAKGYSNDSIQYIKSEADSAYIQNQYERAVELYLQLANECKNDAQLYYNLGCAYYRMDSIAKSVKYSARLPVPQALRRTCTPLAQQEVHKKIIETTS